MRPRAHHLSMDAARAEALFASPLQPSDAPDAGRIRRAVAETMCRFGRTGCAERMAQEFGDHPETAVSRMRWAHSLFNQAFGHTRRFVTPVAAHAGQAA
jgi:hypothetical protein